MISFDTSYRHYLENRIEKLMNTLNKLRRGHSVKLGCNKPLGGICSCGADEQNKHIDEALKVEEIKLNGDYQG